MTYVADVITAVARQTYVWCMAIVTEVQFPRALYIASGNPAPNKIVRDTYDWHVKRAFVLRYTLNHFNAVFNVAISHGSYDWQNSYPRSPNTYINLFSEDKLHR